jgi:hypothetical protein
MKGAMSTGERFLFHHIATRYGAPRPPRTHVLLVRLLLHCGSAFHVMPNSQR